MRKCALMCAVVEMGTGTDICSFFAWQTFQVDNKGTSVSHKTLVHFWIYCTFSPCSHAVSIVAESPAGSLPSSLFHSMRRALGCQCFWPHSKQHGSCWPALCLIVFKFERHSPGVSVFGLGQEPLSVQPDQCGRSRSGPLGRSSPIRLLPGRQVHLSRGWLTRPDGRMGGH